jgi:hypothetical protein
VKLVEATERYCSKGPRRVGFGADGSRLGTGRARWLYTGTTWLTCRDVTVSATRGQGDRQAGEQDGLDLIEMRRIASLLRFCSTPHGYDISPAPPRPLAFTFD